MAEIVFWPKFGTGPLLKIFSYRLFIYFFFKMSQNYLLVFFFFNIFVLQSISSFIIHFKSIFKQFSHKLDMALQVETFMESN